MPAPPIHCDAGVVRDVAPDSRPATTAARVGDHPHPSARTAPDPPPRSAAWLYAATLEALAARADADVSLSLAVPFCATRCLCCDRDIHTAQPGEVIDTYVDTMVEEIRMLTARLGGRRDVRQFHVGAGTATELGESHLARLVEAVERSWRLPADAEISAECDVRRVSERKLRLMRGLGFRHLVFGLFDLDPAVQRAIGRIQSQALVDDACELARGAGFETITLELMVGLPHQAETRWQATLLRLLALAPDRVRLARYRHRPELIPAQHGIDRWALPTPADGEHLAMQAADMLCEAGYRWIGTDLFVLPADPLAQAFEAGQLHRSLISFTATPPVPLLGVGVSATGDIDGHLFRNAPSLAGWRTAIMSGSLAVTQARLAEGLDAQRRRAAEQMLCSLQLAAATVRGGLEDAYARIAGHAREGLVEIRHDHLVVTRAGRHALALLCGELQFAQPG